MNSALDHITIEQLRALRGAGFVVIHGSPLDSMVSAALRGAEWPENRAGPRDEFHRMVAESIRLQNLDRSNR